VCVYMINVFLFSVVDPSVLYQIIDFMDNHPELLKVESYFDCALFNNYWLLNYFVVFCYII